MPPNGRMVCSGTTTSNRRAIGPTPTGTNTSVVFSSAADTNSMKAWNHYFCLSKDRQWINHQKESQCNPNRSSNKRTRLPGLG